MQESESEIDETITTPRHYPTRDIFNSMRRFLFLLGLLLIGWVLLGRFFSHNAPLPHASFHASSETSPAPHQALPVATPPQPPAPAPAAQPDLSLQPKLQSLQDKLDALEQRLAATQNDPRIKQLEDKIEQQQASLLALKNQLGATQAVNAQQLELLTVFGQLKEQIASGEDYAATVSTLQTLAKGQASIEALLAKLAPQDNQLVPSFTALQEGFNATLPLALDAPHPHSLMSNISALIRVRKIGAQQQGASDQAIIARAEAALAKQHVQAALQELSALSPPAAAAYAGWMKQADAYLQVQDTLAALQLALAESKPADLPSAVPAASTAP